MREHALPSPASEGVGQFLKRLRRAGSASGALMMLIALCVAFSASTDNFLDPANLINIGVQSTILLMLALPMTLIIMTEGLDLSMGAVLTLANVVLATIAVSTGNVGLAVAAALGVGVAFGLTNGALVAHLGIPPFVATLGTLGVAQGLALVVTDGQSVVGIPDAILALYSGETLGMRCSTFAALRTETF